MCRFGNRRRVCCFGTITKALLSLFHSWTCCISIILTRRGKLLAIAVCGTFGAVKEHCSFLYAQTMAKHVFLTIAFAPSFTGESGGQSRYIASTNINTEDFQAAVDFLPVQDNVAPERIGITDICW